MIHHGNYVILSLPSTPAAFPPTQTHTLARHTHPTHPHHEALGVGPPPPRHLPPLVLGCGVQVHDAALQQLLQHDPAGSTTQQRFHLAGNMKGATVVTLANDQKLGTPCAAADAAAAAPMPQARAPRTRHPPACARAQPLQAAHQRRLLICSQRLWRLQQHSIASAGSAAWHTGDGPTPGTQAAEIRPCTPPPQAPPNLT